MEPDLDSTQAAPVIIPGEVACSGLAQGRALCCDCAKEVVVTRREVNEAEAKREVERFDAAVAAVEGRILELRESVQGNLGKDEAEILEAQLEGCGARGLIVEKGSLTAHATILARAIGIPLLVQVPEATRRIRPGESAVLDVLAGRVLLSPNEDLQRVYDQLEADLQAHEYALKDLVDHPATTQDGVEVKLSANIGQTAEAAAAAGVKACGAGLYRTEFVFLAQRWRFPSEDEQYRFYRATADHLSPEEVVIRVLDVGSDKHLAYFPLPREANPALGCRGIRLLLSHPQMLYSQLRVILMAYSKGVMDA